MRALLIGSLAVVCTAGVLSAVPARATGRPVTLMSRDGVELSGMFFEVGERPAPAVLLVHMLGRSKDEWSALAERLQESGMAVLTFDLRGHGQSGGSAGQLSAMVGDVAAAISWLATRPNVRPSQMAAVGASLGANLTVLAAGDSPWVRALALLSPSLDYRGIRLDGNAMRKVRDRALWVGASAEDPYALRSLRELVTDDREHSERISPASGHGTLLLTADPEMSRALVDWLRSRLIF